MYSLLNINNRLLYLYFIAVWWSVLISPHPPPPPPPNGTQPQPPSPMCTWHYTQHMYVK